MDQKNSNGSDNFVEKKSFKMLFDIIFDGSTRILLYK